MSKKDFREIAHKIIKIHETSDPFLLAKFLNIQVIKIDFKSWLGLFSSVNGVKTIFINSNLDPLSQKVVCSHELGHSFQQFKDTVFMKENYLFGLLRAENEANEFAATLVFYDLLDEEVSEKDLEILETLQRYK